jgi:hypothetical protein
VKTTLEIPDPIFRQAKARAGALGMPLREFVTQAVQEKLSDRRKKGSKPWMEHFGELAHLHDETMRIQQIIEDEFEQIEPEDPT